MCAPVPKDKWSWKFNECIKCGTQKKIGKYIHKGLGLCLSCWDKKRGERLERKATKKKAHKKWYRKVKKTEGYKEYSRNKVYEWQKSQPLLHKKNWTNRNWRKRFEKFILGKAREAKRTKKGLTYFCETCNKEIKTPIKISTLERSTMMRELKVFKKVHDSKNNVRKFRPRRYYNREYHIT